MEKVKRLFGGIDLNWKKLIVFAIIAGIYTGIMAMLPIAKNTSFADITISFEVWILFGILIIMNSKSAKESSLKCFIFFLISQPLIFLGVHYSGFLNETLYYFPYHLLSTLFCAVTLLLYPICIFNDKKVKIAGIIISLIIIITMTFISLTNNTTYHTTLLVSDSETGEVFDDSYKAYLEDERLGQVHIEYDESLEDYKVDAEFKKAGITNLVLEDSNGNKKIYEIDIKRHTYNITKK